MTSTMPADCSITKINQLTAENSNIELTISPNPFGAYTTISLRNNSEIKSCEFKMYNALGKMVLSTIILNQPTTLDLSGLKSGIYFYTAVSGNKVIQSGKLISQQ